MQASIRQPDKTEEGGRVQLVIHLSSRERLAIILESSEVSDVTKDPIILEFKETVVP